MRTTRIGLLVAVALVIFMGTIFSLGQEQRFWERKVQYEVRFARTNGLQKGAPVSLTGVTVGSVEDMQFPPEPHAQYIQVLINVNRAAANRIRENTVASIRTYGLLGDRYIELSAGSLDSPLLMVGSLIRANDPIDYEEMFGRSGDIVTNIMEVTSSLRDVLQTVQRGEGLLGAMLRNREAGEATLQNLQQTMANVQGTTHSLDQILQRVNRGEGLLGQLTIDSKENAKLVARVNHSVKALETFSTRLSRGQGAFMRLVEDKEYADRVLAKLDRLVADLAEVADKLNRGQGTLGKMVNDPSLYNDMQGLMGRARESWLLRMLGGGGDKESRKPAP